MTAPAAPRAATPHAYSGDALSFIETQFPVSKLSKESYKERKANHGQTLTGLGKWWGRKPLVLVRATILGLLLPNTGDPKRDREIFLKLLTMDEQGLWRRKTKAVAPARVLELLKPAEVRRLYGSAEPTARQRLTPAAREEAQRLAFGRMSYDERLEYCDRPEQVDGPSEAAWGEVNAHLGTRAHSIPDLVRELGVRRWGRVPRVGDAFCGGGSIPFEAARIGCEAYGSDLNPVAALLTWAALNVVGGGEAVAREVREAQRAVYDAVDRQVTEWGIEHNEQGWRADAYLYCAEATCPECGVRVPLGSSWIVGERTRTVAKLRRAGNRFGIEIVNDADPDDLSEARCMATMNDSAMRCPACHQTTPIAVLRGDRRANGATVFGLRMWENTDVRPREDDVYGERLFCIRWVEEAVNPDGLRREIRRFRAPDDRDAAREKLVDELLQARFDEWQQRGFIPRRRIEMGVQTIKPVRTRGWTHWHHLFTPRQLLTLGLLNREIVSASPSHAALATDLLGLQRCADHNSRLSGWSPGIGKEIVDHVFANQALNSLVTYGCRGVTALESAFILNLKSSEVERTGSVVQPADARAVTSECAVWITDPPYADAVSYDQLSEFFLAWYDAALPKLFGSWYGDSRRAFAVSGEEDTSFRDSMVECYRNLAAHMPDDGMQVVMFTHQDAAVWADLALILWAAGLRVTAAWTIATETDSALKAGNYVQGTVLLVLRKQTGSETAFLDEVYPEVEREVRAQLDAMTALDEGEDPNFGDTDYQLAAYAAALRVLTRYKHIEDLDVARELARPKRRGEPSPVEQVIADAVRVAADHLVPHGFDPFVWRTLGPAERFYLKGLDLEAHGELRAGAYQELARGFGVREYRDLMAATRANENRVKSPTEFRTAQMGAEGFGVSLVRHALFAAREAAVHDDAGQGRAWLRTEVPGYWGERTRLVAVLRYLADRGRDLPAWTGGDARAAGLVAGAVENDSV